MNDGSSDCLLNQSKQSGSSPGQTDWKDLKMNKENTPVSECTSTLASNEHLNVTKSVQFNLQVTSSSFIKAQFSTPKNVLSRDVSNANNSSNTASQESEFSITNPFENQSTIDSLLQPSLSPSIFDSVSNNTVNKSVSQSPESFWNIDQIAIMNPVDIDLSKLHEQQNFVKFEPSMEVKAQQAIDSFFANGVNITSPWSSADRPHYLAIISPAVATSTKKRSALRRDPTGTPTVFTPSAPILEKEETADNKTTNVGTQTFLSFPVDMDLTKIFGNYFLQGNVAGSKNATETNEVLSNSSLRRKLFFHDVDEPENLEDSCFEAAAKPNVTKKTSEDLDAFPMSSESYHEKVKLFSGECAKTPLLKSKYSVPKTPSTCQSPFSSSPVTGGRMFDLGTPCDSREKNEVKLDCFSPGPDYSPIQCTRNEGKSAAKQPSINCSSFSSSTENYAESSVLGKLPSQGLSCDVSCIDGGNIKS